MIKVEDILDSIDASKCEMLMSAYITGRTDIKKLYEVLQNNNMMDCLVPLLKNSRNLYAYRFDNQTVLDTIKYGSNTKSIWNLYQLLNMPYLTITHVIDNMHLDWDWREVTLRFFCDEYRNHPDLPWDLSFIFEHKDYSSYYNEYDTPGFVLLAKIDKMAEEFVKPYPHLNWDWDHLSAKCLTQFIMDNKMLPWNWDIVIKRKDDHYNDNAQVKWDWRQFLITEEERLRPLVTIEWDLKSFLP